MTKKPITITLPEQIHTKAKQLTQKKGQTLSGLIRILLEKELQQEAQKK